MCSAGESRLPGSVHQADDLNVKSYTFLVNVQDGSNECTLARSAVERSVFIVTAAALSC